MRATSLIVKYNEMCKLWKKSIMEKKFVANDEDYLIDNEPSLFVKSLLQSLESFFDNSPRINRLVCHMLLQLVYYPLPILYSYLFRHSNDIKEGGLCVSTIVFDKVWIVCNWIISSKMILNSEKHPSWTERWCTLSKLWIDQNPNQLKWIHLRIPLLYYWISLRNG